MGFTNIPTSVSIGGFSTEIATAKAAQGDYDVRVANALLDFATEVNANAVTAQAQISVPLSGGILAAGTPMAAWSDNASSNPGITLTNSEAYGIRWNNNGTQTAVWFGVAMPQDLDDSAAIVLHILASKIGSATDADDVPSPSVLSFSIKPTDGTLGTDDVMVHGLWFEYTRKVLAS